MLEKVTESLKRAAAAMDLTTVAQLLSASLVTVITIHAVAGYMRRSKLNKKRTKKKEDCRRKLEELQKRVAHVSQKQLDLIGSLSASEIIEKVKKNELSPEEILEVFQHKASKVHQLTNCLCEPVPNAQEVALRSLETGGKLCGLPVSLKENLGLKGLDSTAGSAHYIDLPYNDDCVIVKVLKRQGAVPFVRTNIPHTMISWETTNPIYGLTTNPLTPGQPARTVGGSSGGEGALLAAHGSLLGFGSDIGGSLRIPAACCGIASFKPTVGRLSSKGTHALMKGQTCVRAAYGPMARDVDTLVLALNALMVPYMWELDPSLAPLPFNKQVYESKDKLTIGYYDDNQVMQAVPAMKRGVSVARDLLEKQGHKLVSWNLQKKQFGLRAAQLWTKSICGDNGEALADMLKDDAIDMAAQPLAPLALPVWLRKILAQLISLFPAHRDLAATIRLSWGKGVPGWWEHVKEVQELQQDVIEDWRSLGLDAVIAPGLACPAPTVGAPGKLPGATTYTGMYNVVDFPAGSLPITKVTAEDEAAMVNYPTKTSPDRVMKKAMEGSVGLPVNVQVATLPFQDELCLRLMKELETAISQQGIS